MHRVTKTRFTDDQFHKSTTSDHKPLCCVEVARDEQGVAIRDSKDPGKTTLEFNNDEWAAFLEGAKRGEFEPVK